MTGISTSRAQAQAVAGPSLASMIHLSKEHHELISHVRDMEEHNVLRNRCRPLAFHRNVLYDMTQKLDGLFGGIGQPSRNTGTSI